MPTVLIAGASRGIGLALANEFANAGWTVHATHRGAAPTPDLAAVPGVTTHRVEVTDTAAVAGLAAALSDTPIDLFIHNAGVADPRFDLTNAEADVWLDRLHINSVAPIMTAAALLPTVLASEQKKIVFVSSDLGSIGAATTGNHMVYRMTKAALNAGVRYVANVHADDGLIAIAVHPGWVQTDMGGDQAPLTPQQSAANLRRLAEGLTPADNGRFLAHDGQEIPW